MFTQIIYNGCLSLVIFADKSRILYLWFNFLVKTLSVGVKEVGGVTQKLGGVQTWGACVYT